MESLIFRDVNLELGMAVDVTKVPPIRWGNPKTTRGEYRVRLMDLDAEKPVSVTFCPNLTVAMGHAAKITNQ